MTTDTLARPETETELRTDDHPVHWACLIQDQMPYLGLCGDLPVEQRRRPGSKVTCARCLPLIGGHIAVCGACRPFGSHR